MSTAYDTGSVTGVAAPAPVADDSSAPLPAVVWQEAATQIGAYDYSLCRFVCLDLRLLLDCGHRLCGLPLGFVCASSATFRRIGGYWPFSIGNLKATACSNFFIAYN